MTLLIEPQVNPIKHFPVVTVSHKLILPFLPHLTYVLVNLNVMDRYQAGLTATVIVTSIPGIFGFLAWELKENWASLCRQPASDAQAGDHPAATGKRCCGC